MCTATLRCGDRTFIGPCAAAYGMLINEIPVEGEIRKANGLWRTHKIPLHRSTPAEVKCLLNCAQVPMTEHEFKWCENVCRSFWD